MKKSILVAFVAGCLALSIATANADNPVCKVPIPASKAATAKTTVPDVKYPYTFKCPHCGMTLTITKPSDWAGDCGGCACGGTNLSCYNDAQKKSKK